eukprot:1333453-Rhodomonas_salina.1
MRREGMGSEQRGEERGRDGVRAEREGIGEGWGRDDGHTERGREGEGWGVHWERTRREGMGCEGKGWGASGERRRGEKGWGKLWCTLRERKRKREEETRKVDLQTMQVVSMWAKEKRKGQTKGGGSKEA